MKKLRAKGRAIVKAKSSFSPPQFNIMDYNLSMIRALNYYSAELDDDEKKKGFAIKYWESLNLDTKKIKPLPDHLFHTVGAVAHMALNGIPLNEHDLLRLGNAYTQLLQMAPEEKSVEEVKKPTVVDRTNELASKYIGEVEGELDNLFLGDSTFVMKDFIKRNEIKGVVSKKIGDWFKPKIKEYQAVYEGDNEGYENFGKRKLKKIVDFLTDVVSSCETMATIAKTMRAPRKRKAIPPSKQVAKLKFMREFTELNLKSVDPTKLIGSTQVWLYNTKLRRLFKYEALDGMEFGVKGCSLLNWDPEKSGGKIIRKPEVQLKGVASMTKRPMSNLFNDINATMSKASGRFNDDTIIVCVF